MSVSLSVSGRGRCICRRLFAGLAAFAWLAVAAGAATAQTFQTAADFAILMDARTRGILFAKAPDAPMVPASLVKIMTAAVVFEEIKAGRLSLEDTFIVSENAWRRGGAPSGGSTMFAIVNSRVSVADLLRGLIVQSGNDAAIALAEGIAGTEENFARLMNERARAIGLRNSTFRNATGYADPEQRTTARDLAQLSLYLVENFPDLYAIFGEREFTWNKIRQQNRNPLLAMDIGADGLKTGNLAESGYGLVGSAVRDGQRLVVVLNGLPNARERANEGRKLIDWGFNNFETRELFRSGEVIDEAQVYGGAKGRVPLLAREAVRVLVPRGTSDRLDVKVVYRGPLRAPVAAGMEVGHLRVTRDDVDALVVPLYTGEAVESGSLSQRAFDALFELSTGAIRDALSKLL
ncbi:D-alanyl-D-alanine carboxypeptidase [Chelatococcus daeguensis]|uniref:serine-type D-Ala-D-Ala carboxypeptidase n=2 Tax=Chelatococcus TaxID=28209 RepID=A0AAC9NZ38_9HYPH|nr:MULTISPECIES: D-alanyl-D-alanine carboxypeptidase family protein [Chelatococcus]APF37625.1 D-alanyl-D-alanine carboxypeptidase [Chelatococcus daeguensis]KZE36579.1 D-alanyl-D-alanine carboxypeptidase [Chelatococcus daeguensis]MBM3082182.1 D-alanyl-D-alanine carboxypeptidase [Chelatococcus daeguensis]CUA85909.1 D-alanyl-D-alanine carboxypeptidase [Chelatococcus sambhunathii]